MELACLGELTAELAHELRGALQIIASAAFVAGRSPSEAPAQLARIERTAAAAQLLVGDVLALAQGPLDRAEPVSLDDVLAEARATQPATALRFVDHAEGLSAHVHPRLFARLLSILYDNARLAGATTIWTRARRSAGELTVEVEDDGPGVPADLAPRVLEPLVSGRAGGTGLGLALARRIAEGHGGALELCSAAPRPALFRATLPDVT